MIELNGPEIRPSSGNKPDQLIVLLHGVGADGNDLISLAPEFAKILPDAHFVSPNAPYPCDMAPFGHQWFSLQDRDPVRILKEVQETAPIVDNFLSNKLTELSLTDKNLSLIGFSQGTMMSLFVGPRREKGCAGILGYSGAIIGEELLDMEKKSSSPVCLVHGNADMVVDFQLMRLAESTLNKNGFKTEAHEINGLGHGIDFQGIEIGKNFLQRIFK